MEKKTTSELDIAPLSSRSIPFQRLVLQFTLEVFNHCEVGSPTQDIHSQRSYTKSLKDFANKSIFFFSLFYISTLLPCPRGGDGKQEVDPDL